MVISLAFAWLVSIGIGVGSDALAKKYGRWAVIIGYGAGLIIGFWRGTWYHAAD